MKMRIIRKAKVWHLLATLDVARLTQCLWPAMSNHAIKSQPPLIVGRDIVYAIRRRPIMM